jgi:hypothetical protein
VLADHEIEGPIRQGHVLSIGLDQGEHQPNRCWERAAVGNRAGLGALPGKLAGQVGGAAAQLDHIQVRDVAEDAQVALGDMEQPPGELGRSPGPVGILVGELCVHNRPRGAVAGKVRSGSGNENHRHGQPPSTFWAGRSCGDASGGTVDWC